MEKQVLLIEAGQKQAEKVCTFLPKEVKISVACNVKEAIAQMMRGAFDVVAMNEMVEQGRFLIDLLLDLRQSKNMHMMLYSIQDAFIRASFLRQGFDMCLADDEPRECAAAIEALLRWTVVGADQKTPGYIVYKGLTLDPHQQKVKVHGKDVSLTTTEFRLLYFLASNPNWIFSKETIYEQVWKDNSAYGTESVPNYICSIRKKLGLSARSGTYIRTINGAGYCFAKIE